LPLFGLAVGVNLEGILRDNVTSQTINAISNNSSLLTSQAPFLVTLERKYRQTLSIYINGKLVSSLADNQAKANIDMVKLGRHKSNISDNLNFDISEFIYYVGNIANEDRDAIEEYLGKKYGLKISNN